MKALSRCLKVGSLSVGALFLWAGLHTIWQPAEVALALAVLTMNIKLSTVLAICVGVVQIHIGLLLLLRHSSDEALRWGIALLFCFTVFLWYLRTLATPPSCGCPGLHGLFSSNCDAALFGMIRNVVLMLLLLGTFAAYRQDPKNSCKDTITVN